jgi:hypothetical protein
MEEKGQSSGQFALRLARVNCASFSLVVSSIFISPVTHGIVGLSYRIPIFQLSLFSIVQNAGSLSE